jgi:hypothetical protein
MARDFALFVSKRLQPVAAALILLAAAQLATTLAAAERSSDAVRVAIRR